MVVHFVNADFAEEVDMECPNCGHDLTPPTHHAVRRGGPAPYGFVGTGEELAFDVGRRGLTLASILVANRRGRSTRQIAHSLNAQREAGPSGGTWSHGSVARVIRQGKKLSHLIPIEYVLTD